MDNQPPVEEKPVSPVTPPAAMPAETGGAYGKKGSWVKWLLIYVVIAVVVYGVIYYFIKHNGGDTGTTGY